MILRNILEIFLALLCVHKTGAETRMLEHELSPTVQLENVAEVGRNTAEYQDYQVLSRLVSMLEMRLENAERQLLELKDVKEKSNTLENKVKDVSERLNHADKRIAELEWLVKKHIADNQTIPKQLFEEETNSQVNKNYGESSLHSFPDELNSPKRPNTTSILKAKTGKVYSVRRDTGSRQVAFAVAFQNHKSISPGQTAPFDTVLHNEGNHYNSNSHMFTCPVAGTYLFTLSATCGSGNIGSYLTLIVNGDAKAATVSSPGVGGLSNQGSSTTVTRCEAGQNVWSEAGGNAGNFLYGYYTTSFSGFLLWTDPLGSK